MPKNKRILEGIKLQSYAKKWEECKQTYTAASYSKYEMLNLRDFSALHT